MSYEVVPTQDRASWLAARRQGIGASDIAGIMGLSPWTTPFQVWASKVYDIPEDTDDEAMHWGQVLESVILDEWGKDNYPVVDRGLLIRSTEHPHFMATPDGLTDTGRAGAVVEAKNSTDWRWSEVPTHYRLQVQWQLVVTGYPLGYLIVLHGGRQLSTYEIEADPDLQAEMIEAANDFWKLVEADEAPPVEADDYTIMSSLWPREIIQAVEVPADAALELYAAKEARDTGKSRYEAAAAAVKYIMGDAGEAVVDQQVIATWKGEPRRFVVKGEGLE